MNTERDDRIDPAATAPLNSHPHTEPERKRSWLWWLLGALATLILLILLARSCDDATDRSVVDPAVGTSADTGGRVSDAGDPMVPAGAYRATDFDAYLAGTEPIGRAFALDQVNFDSGSSEIDDAGRAEIAELAGVLRRYPNATIALTGFADPAGDAAANQALSRRRAEAVRVALIDAGANTARVTIVAQGETGDAALRANRKVEVRVTAR